MVKCVNCDKEYDHSELVHNKSCPTCGKQLTFSANPSRGSIAELLVEERVAAETTEERDVYRALLHLLACNLLGNEDIAAFIYHRSTSDHLDYVLKDALETTGTIDSETRLQCPNCEEPIDTRARWFKKDYENSIKPTHALR